MMRAGRIVQQGTAEDLYRRPADLLGEKFIDLDPGHSAKGPFPEGQPLPSKAGVRSLAELGTGALGMSAC